MASAADTPSASDTSSNRGGHPLRVCFMGTPDFAATALNAILNSAHTLVCVYSQPPRPKGRGHKVQKSPVHVLADAHDIPVFTPKNLKNEEAKNIFKSHDIDVAIVAAYGLILPQDVLDAPKFGCINIHGSLLPRWRGASPIQHAIWMGDTETGITTMQMDAGLDTGAMISKQTIAITQNTTAQSLHDALANLGGDMIVQDLNALANTLAQNCALNSTPQDNAHSTYAPLLKKSDGQVTWSDKADKIDRQIRALNPWPGTWINKDTSIFKIVSAHISGMNHDQPCGTVLNKKGDIACGGGSVIRITSIKPPNKGAMDFPSALNGGYISIGDVLS